MAHTVGSTTAPQGEADPAEADPSCDVSPEVGRVPLVALLGRTGRAFEVEFDRRLVASEFCSLSLAHSRNILRHLGSGPMRASQIVRLSDISKQAVSQQLAHLERSGYIAVEPDPIDQRAHNLALTDRGRAAQELVQRLFVEIEDDWSALVGGDDVARLREILAGLLEHLPRARGC